MSIQTKLISSIIVCHRCKWLQAITFACSPRHKMSFLWYTICFLFFFVNWPCLIALFFCLSYVVLFPRRLSPKLPVLTLALANSSASKQKTDTEPGIFILKSYCLLETFLASLETVELPIKEFCGSPMFSSVVHISISFHPRLCLWSPLSNGPPSFVSAVFFFSSKSGKITWLTLLCCV